MNDENELIFEEAPDFEGEPQEILRKHLTPKALARTWEELEHPDLKIADKAIERVGKWDRRLQPEPTPAAQVAVLNFDPEHLKTAIGGMKEMLGGVQKTALPGPTPTAVDGERVDDL